MESTEREIVRHKLLYGPEAIIPEGRKDELKQLEIWAAALMVRLEIEGSNDDTALLLQAADIMSELGLDERHRSLLLTLLEGALIDARRVEEVRGFIRAELEEELACIREENESQLKPAQIRILLDAAREDARAKLSQPSTVLLKQLSSRSATALEAAYIREEVERSRRKKEVLRKGLMAALGVSEGSVNSSVAHSKIGNGGKTVQDILDALRRSVKKEDIRSREVSLSTGDPYEFLVDPKDTSFLDGLRTVSERQWVFGITLLTPEPHRSEARARAAALVGKRPQQLHSQAAYLTGTLWEAARKTQSSIFTDAMVTYDYMASKEVAPEEEEPDTVPPEKIRDLSDVSRVSVETRGDTFDYDNPVKRAWRATWFQYVADHTRPEDRPNLRVACLPGRLGLEIPGYIELGFRANNIVGFEGSPRIQREFFEMAERFGIQAVGERLEDALPRMEVPFDVVNLDFTTAIQDESALIFRKLLLGDHAVCAVNVLGKRDGELSKSALAMFAKRLELNQGPIHDGVFSTAERQRLRSVVERATHADTYAVAESREKGLPFLVAEALGQMRVENWLDPKQLANFPGYKEGKWHEYEVLETIERAFALIADAIGNAYSELYPLSRRQSPDFRGKLTGLTNNAYSAGVQTTFRLTQTTDVRHMRYISPNRSPFHTILVNKERPVEVYRRFEDIGHFFSDVSSDMLKADADKNSGEIFLSRRRGARISPERVVGNAGQLQLIYSSPRVNHQLRLVRLDDFKRAITPFNRRTIVQRSFSPGFEIPIEEISALE